MEVVRERQAGAFVLTPSTLAASCAFPDPDHQMEELVIHYPLYCQPGGLRKLKPRLAKVDQVKDHQTLNGTLRYPAK